MKKKKITLEKSSKKQKDNFSSTRLLSTEKFDKRCYRLRSLCFSCPSPCTEGIFFLLDKRIGTSILDLSCGNGSNPRSLSKAGYCVTESIDVLPAQNVSRGYVVDPETPFRCKKQWEDDLTSSYLRDDWYDVLLLGNVLYYTYNSDTLIESLMPKITKDAVVLLSVGDFTLSLRKELDEILNRFPDFSLLYKNSWSSKTRRSCRNGEAMDILLRRKECQ